MLLALLTITRQGKAMFVATSEEKKKLASDDQELRPAEVRAEHPADVRTREVQDTRQDRPTPPSTMRPEDSKVKEEIREIIPYPIRKQTVNSNRFVRMSGETNKLKPVTVNAPSVKRGDPLPVAPREYADPQERIFSIGSWIFVLACVAAAVIGLVRIRRLTTSNRGSPSGN
jgi:hypothetical protein